MVKSITNLFDKPLATGEILVDWKFASVTQKFKKKGSNSLLGELLSNVRKQSVEIELYISRITIFKQSVAEWVSSESFISDTSA